MKSVVLLFLVTVFMMSCAALGSKTKIYDEQKLTRIRTVGLVTKRYDQSRNSYHKLIKESFTRTLIQELNEKELFQVIVLDTMENEGLRIETIKVGSTIDAYIDAILLAEWKLVNPNSMVTDSKVTLSIIDKNTSQTLITSVHGTTFGNSYMWTPRLPKTLLDATEGAVNALAKNIKK